MLLLQGTVSAFSDAADTNAASTSPKSLANTAAAAGILGGTTPPPARRKQYFLDVPD